MGKSRPGSKRGRVRAVYDKRGEAAALKVARELQIRDSKFHRWVRIWSGKLAVTKPASAKNKTLSGFEEIKRRRRSGEPTAFEVGDKVQLVFDLDLPVATCIGKGPEQSVIKWPTGVERNVSNDWLCKAA
jgi:hypothetical protein